MGDTYITDMTHFEGVPPGLARGPAGRLARYLGSIASAASVLDIGVWRDTAIACRRRPGRRPCPGHIQVHRRGHFASIEWHCSSCDDQGVISNWKESTWNLSEGERQGSHAAKPAEIVVGEEEMREMRRILLDRINQRVIDGAKTVPAGFVLCGSEDNFEDLQDYVGTEANREPGPRRRSVLGRIFDRIEDLLVEALDAESDLGGEDYGGLPPLTAEPKDFLDDVQKRLGDNPE